MKARGFLVGLCLLGLVACQSQETVVPTLIQIATFTPSAEPSQTEVGLLSTSTEVIPTATPPAPTETFTFTPTATILASETVQPPSDTPEPPTATEVVQIPTATPEPPTATEVAVLPSATPEPPTEIAQLPTETPTITLSPTVEPSATTEPATLTPEPPTATATMTSTQTFTFTPSPTETAVFSPTPSKTLAPTFTPEPETAIVATASDPTALTAQVTAQNLNIRNGPGENFDVIAHLENTNSVRVLGTNDAQDWLLIEFGTGSQGWVYTDFVSLTGNLEVVPNMQPTPLPDFVRLEGVTWIQQQFNNCAPTAVTMALTYYGGGTDQEIARDWMRPTHTRDVSVDIQQMVDYINETQPGLRSVWRMGGEWTTIRRLLAAGFPVIIETSVQVNSPSPGWAGHNRLLIGYDGNDILTYDSFLGHGNFQGYRILQDELDEVWRHMNRHYMVIYSIEREAEVAYLMGQAWSVPASIERAHEIALAEMAADPNNVFAQFNLGATYSAQGKYEEAAVAFDAAFEAGKTGTEAIPFRIFWYQFDVFETYYHVGRYNEVIDHARRALLNMGGNGAEELYYWLGMGYAGRGQMEKAQVQFENAVTFNPHFKSAAEALEQIATGTFKPPV